MTVDEFKRELAALIRENRNEDAVRFAQSQLPTVRDAMSPADRLLVADWMEGVDMALDLGMGQPGNEARR